MVKQSFLQINNVNVIIFKEPINLTHVLYTVYFANNPLI